MASAIRISADPGMAQDWPARRGPAIVTRCPAPQRSARWHPAKC